MHTGNKISKASILIYLLVLICFSFPRIALNYVKQTFNVQLYQEIVKRMADAWLVIYFILMSIFSLVPSSLREFLE